MQNYLSTNIKFLRTKKGLTQEEFAKLLDKDYSTIGKWENGSRSPITEDVIKISEIFNVSLEKILLSDLRIKQDHIQENKIEQNLKKYALDNGVELTINKHKELSAEDALKIQNEIQNILIDEIKKNKN